MERFAELNAEPQINRQENAKSILENMDGILNELYNTLYSIDAAIFSPKPQGENAREPIDECLLGTLRRNRNKAEEILKIAMHIREGLW